MYSEEYTVEDVYELGMGQRVCVRVTLSDSVPENRHSVLLGRQVRGKKAASNRITVRVAARKRR